MTTKPSRPRRRLSGRMLLLILLADTALVIGVALWLLWPDDAAAQAAAGDGYSLPPARTLMIEMTNEVDGERVTGKIRVEATPTDDGLIRWVATPVDPPQRGVQRMAGLSDRSLLLRQQSMTLDTETIHSATSFNRRLYHGLWPLEAGKTLVLPVVSYSNRSTDPVFDLSRLQEAQSSWGQLAFEVGDLHPFTLDDGTEGMAREIIMTTLPAPLSDPGQPQIRRRMLFSEELSTTVLSEETVTLPQRNVSLVNTSRLLAIAPR